MMSNVILELRSTYSPAPFAGGFVYSSGCEQEWNLVLLHLGHVTCDMESCHQLVFSLPADCSHSWGNPVSVMKSGWALTLWRRTNEESSGPWMTAGSWGIGHGRAPPWLFRKREQAALWPSLCVESLPRFTTSCLGDVWLVTASLENYEVEWDSFEHY